MATHRNSNTSNAWPRCLTPVPIFISPLCQAHQIFWKEEVRRSWSHLGTVNVRALSPPELALPIQEENYPCLDTRLATSTVFQAEGGPQKLFRGFKGMQTRPSRTVGNTEKIAPLHSSSAPLRRPDLVLLCPQGLGWVSQSLSNKRGAASGLLPTAGAEFYSDFVYGPRCLFSSYGNHIQFPEFIASFQK